MASGGSDDGREDDLLLHEGDADPPAVEAQRRRRRRRRRGRRGTPAAEEDPPLLDGRGPVRRGRRGGSRGPGGSTARGFPDVRRGRSPQRVRRYGWRVPTWCSPPPPQCMRVDEDETAGLISFEFLVFLRAGFMRWLKLPGMFVEELSKYPPCELRMREASGEQPVWDLEIRMDNTGHMFLCGGWQDFTTHYELHVGPVLKLRYSGEGRLSVKIFDDTLCRRSYYPPLPDEFGPDSP